MPDGAVQRGPEGPGLVCVDVTAMGDEEIDHLDMSVLSGHVEGGPLLPRGFAEVGVGVFGEEEGNALGVPALRGLEEVHLFLGVFWGLFFFEGKG